MKSKRRQLWRVGILTLAGMLIFANGVLAMPSGGTIAAGTGSIVSGLNKMDIYQRSAKLIINWRDFSIAGGEKVVFLQPGTSAICLNRVVGNDPSAIFGQLSGNGRVFLVNTNGIIFAPGSSVSTGGLVASTMNISNADFLDGRYTFTSGAAKIVNQGEITTNNGGYVVLLAPEISNTGIIAANKGTAALGAGKVATLNLTGDGLVKLSIDGAALQAVIDNKGMIKASGGQVFLEARSLDNLALSAVNHSGLIEAKSIDGLRAQVIIDAGENGTALISGKIAVTGEQAGQIGGTVKVLGNKVNVLSGASIDASGQAGGGTILVGGNFQGKGIERNAVDTIVAESAVLKADALKSGNGGNVVVWANGTTQFQGAISAKGGALQGDGGRAEVSGKQVLNYQGTTDLQAPNGKTGSLLLDPTNIYITSGGGPVSGISFESNGGNTSTISGANLSSALNSANVILQADNDIQISAGITGTTLYNGLTLQAGRSIIIDSGAQVSTNHGNVTAIINDEHANSLYRDVSPGSYAQFQMKDNSQINTNGGNLTVQSGTLGGSPDGYVLIGGGSGHTIINAGGGNIKVSGITASGADKGILITNHSEIKTTGGGTIVLDGTGKSGGDHSSGISITSGSTVSLQNGDMSISGKSRGTSNHNTGIEVDDGAMVKSTGTGNITMTGTGGPGADSNYGFYLSNAQITVQDGSLVISGTAKGNDISNHGVIFKDSAAVSSTGLGSIAINGTAGSGLHDNYGIQLDLGAGITSQIGDICLTGTGKGNEYFNVGIVLSNGAFVKGTGTAKIKLDGTGGGISGDSNSRDEYGIWLTNNGFVESNNGAVTIKGIAGNGAGSFNSGIRMDTGTKIEGTGHADILLNGTGGSGANGDHGVWLNGNSMKLGSGNLSISGTGGGTGSNNAGVYLDSNTFTSASGSSSVSITGIGGQGTIQNDGVHIAGSVDATEVASITIDGKHTDILSNGIYSAGSTLTGTDIVLKAADAQGGAVNASGYLTLSLDKFDIATFTSSPVGSGGITIQPYTAGKTVTVGGTGTGLNLTQSALNSLGLGAGKTLQIGGIESGDVIIASALSQTGRDIILSSGANVNLSAPLTAKTISINATQDIHMSAAGNADSIVLSAGRDIYLSASGNAAGGIQLRGSAGDNTFYIGSGNLDGQASLDIKGLGGHDSIILNDAANTQNGNYTIDPAAVGRLSGTNMTMSYQGISQVRLKAGVGRVNTVTTKMLPGVEQVLSGGNSNESILIVDCHGITPLVTAAMIKVSGYGTIFYDGFKTIQFINLPVTPAPSGITDAIPYPQPEDQAAGLALKNEGKLDFVTSKEVAKKKKADGSILIVDDGIKTSDDE